MWFTAANKAKCVVAIAAALMTVPALAAAPNAKLAPVAALYRSFAWEALTGDTALFGHSLAGQPSSELSKYFATDLAKLIADDAACQTRSRELCRLDFDILFDSQDPRVVDLRISPGPSNTVAVTFKDPVTDEATLISYSVVRAGNMWRISDVAYKGAGRKTLRALLAKSAHRGLTAAPR